MVALPPASLDALMLDADERQMLVALRSLGRAGLAVGAAERTRRAPAFRSRWCRGAAVLPVGGEAALAAAIVGLLDETPTRVLYCAHDGTIEAIRSRRADIDRRTAVALAAEPALAIATSKPRTLALARELGLTTPRGVEVSTPGQVAAALVETGLPAVVKPVRSWLSSGAGEERAAPVAVLDVREAERAVEDLARLGGGAIIQEWIRGRREAVSLLYARGRVWAAFAQAATRMLPSLGGSSVLRESIALPADAAAAAERLVRAMGLEGYSEIEFRRDARGRPVLMEVNPRLSASVEIAVRAGVDFPLLLYRWATGQPLFGPRGYRTGLRVRWLGGDVRRVAESAATPGRPDVTPLCPAVGAFLLDFLRPAAYDYVALDDPRPMLSAVRSTLGDWMGKLARAAAGAAGRDRFRGRGGRRVG